MGCLQVLPGRKPVIEDMNFSIHAEFERVDHKIPDQLIIFHNNNLNVGYDRPPHAIFIAFMLLDAARRSGFHSPYFRLSSKPDTNARHGSPGVNHPLFIVIWVFGQENPGGPEKTHGTDEDLRPVGSVGSIAGA